MSDKLHALARIFRLFRLLCALFFPLLAIVPALGFFCRSRKALHCNWRAFSIVDRLYFSRNFLVHCKPANRLYLQVRQNLT